MATWQFDFFLVPKGMIEEKLGELPFSLDYALYEDVNWWQNSLNIGNITKRILSALPESKSWSKNIRMWGEEESNRIDLFYENQHVSECFVRADTRDVSIAFLVFIVSLAADFGLIIWTVEGHLIDPSFKDLRHIIEESGASSFSNDPVKFFDQLKSQSRGDNIVRFNEEEPEK